MGGTVEFGELALDLSVPVGQGPHPVVLWIHNGQRIATDALRERLLSRGYAVADVDCRVNPDSLHDVKAAIAWLRGSAGSLNLDPGRFAALGESAGGHLAALAALTSDDSTRLHAVVDWYGVSDVVGDFEFDSELTPDAQAIVRSVTDHYDEAVAASPVTHVHADAPPFLCMHGTQDRSVPFSQSQRLAYALWDQGVRCDLFPVPGADHCFVGASNVASLVEASVDFLDDVL